MAASDKTVESILDVLQRYLEQDVIRRVVRDLLEVPGNQSFRDTILKLATKTRADAQRLADEFNSRLPLGAPITYYPLSNRRDDPKQTTLRSKAFVLESGEPVCFVTGVSGCVHVSHVESRL